MKLTSEDKTFFKENGYLVKHDTLTDTQVNAGVDEMSFAVCSHARPSASLLRNLGK